MSWIRKPSTQAKVILKGLLARPGDLRVALRMPGKMHVGPLPVLTDAQAALGAELRRDVEYIAFRIGDRNVFKPHRLHECQAWLTSELKQVGATIDRKVERQSFPVRGVDCANLWIDFPGSTKPNEIVLVGAHYDSVPNCPAANDNGTGVAAVLALARRFAPTYYQTATRPARTLRLAFFVNEEPPHFWTEDMGSLRLARIFKARNDHIVAMLTPETIGCYLDEPGSQKYPLPLGSCYPTTGNFIAFIGLGESGRLVKRCVGLFRDSTAFPCIGAALPATIPGVGASDHWSFWRMGYPALMITDTAPFRYAHYHEPTDTPDKIDFERCARVVEGIGNVVDGLLSAPRV